MGRREHFAPLRCGRDVLPAAPLLEAAHARGDSGSGNRGVGSVYPGFTRGTCRRRGPDAPQVAHTRCHKARMRHLRVAVRLDLTRAASLFAACR
jgi:hypothetical protein